MGNYGARLQESIPVIFSGGPRDKKTANIPFRYEKDPMPAFNEKQKRIGYYQLTPHICPSTKLPIMKFLPNKN